MILLKQSTAATIKVGPFLSNTDGDTEKTALAIAQADIRLSKNGNAFAQSHNAAGATHDEKGNYAVPLDATDTNTVGRLRIHIHVATALAVWENCFVLPAAIYDWLTGAATLGVDLVDIPNADAVAALQVGLATEAGQVALIEDVSDLATDLAAIKAKTDTINAGGELVWTYTLTEEDLTTPIPDASIRLTTDSAGQNTIRTGITNALGVATFYFDLQDSGMTVYVWRTKAGWDFTNPDTEVVS